MYPQSITDKERELGFELREVKSSDMPYMGQPERVNAVILELGPSDYIFKISDPGGNVRYSHQRYGLFEWEQKKGISEPDWRPVGELSFSPENAIQRYETGEDEKENPAKIIPYAPES